MSVNKITMSRVFVEDEDVEYEGNTLRTTLNDPFVKQRAWPVTHVFNRSFDVRSGSFTYTDYAALRDRAYCMNYFQEKPGFYPGIRMKRISFQGNLHWSDDGVHLQSYGAYGPGFLDPPMVFMAIVYDSGTVHTHLPIVDPTVELQMPELQLYNVWNLRMLEYDQEPYNATTMPMPFPESSAFPSQEKRYQTLWSKTIILPNDPILNYETISLTPVPLPPAPPITFEREYRWLNHIRYFRGCLDVDLPTTFNFTPAVLAPPATGSPFLIPATGALYFVCWTIGGATSGGSPQPVYCNMQFHVIHDNHEIY